VRNPFQTRRPRLENRFLSPSGKERCVPWNVSKAQPQPPEGDTYLVLTSRVVDPHGLVLSGFAAACGERHRSLVLENLKAGDLQNAIDEIRPRGIVVVGMAAYGLARREAADLPVLFSQIANPTEAGLDGPELVGVTPWIPFEPLMRHILSVLPKKKTLAVIFPSGPFADPAQAAVKRIRKSGRKVSLFELSDSSDLQDILKKATTEAEAWIVFPDRRIINREVYNHIQVAAEDKKIPIAVSDEDHVRLGSLVGAGPDNHRIGRQLCHLAGALSRNQLPEGSHIFCPEYSFAVIHNVVMEKLDYMVNMNEVKQAKLYKWH